MSLNYYRTLGVAETANAADIKKAYYNLCKQFHPDVNGGDQQKMVELNTAYEHLSSTLLRSAYDRALAEQRRAAATATRPVYAETPRPTYQPRAQAMPKTYRRPAKKPLNIRMRPWIIAGGLAVAITYATLYILPVPVTPASAQTQTTASTADTTQSTQTPTPSVAATPPTTSTTDQTTDTSSTDTTQTTPDPSQTQITQDQTQQTQTQQTTQTPTKTHHKTYVWHWPISQ
jgi:curved DNA-binding protein CbpA